MLFVIRQHNTTKITRNLRLIVNHIISLRNSFIVEHQNQILPHIESKSFTRINTTKAKVIELSKLVFRNYQRYPSSNFHRTDTSLSAKPRSQLNQKSSHLVSKHGLERNYPANRSHPWTNLAR